MHLLIMRFMMSSKLMNQLIIKGNHVQPLSYRLWQILNLILFFIMFYIYILTISDKNEIFQS